MRTTSWRPIRCLALEVDDLLAVYPVTVDPTIVNEDAKLLASDGGIGQGFGQSVDVSGDTVVVGAHHDSDNGLRSGSAYVFELVPRNQPPVCSVSEGSSGLEILGSSHNFGREQSFQLNPNAAPPLPRERDHVTVWVGVSEGRIVEAIADDRGARSRAGALAAMWGTSASMQRQNVSRELGEGLRKWRARFGPTRVMSVSVVAGVALSLPLFALCRDPILMGRRAYLLAAILLPAMGVLGALAIVCRGSLRHALVPTIVGLSISVALWTDLEQTGPYTTSVSWNEYGERGFEETVSFLEDNVGESVPVVRKDLAYAMLRERPDRSLNWIYTVILRQDLTDPEVASGIEERLLDPSVLFLVTDRYSSSAADSALLLTHFEPVRRFGDFRVFRKRSPDP